MVGKETLHKVMRSLGLKKFDDAKVQLKVHRFGPFYEGCPSLFAVKLRFSERNADGKKIVEFDISFDFIDGSLPFLIGLPTL